MVSMKKIIVIFVLLFLFPVVLQGGEKLAENTYKEFRHCLHCDETLIFDVPKGIYFKKEFNIEKYQCPNCGILWTKIGETWIGIRYPYCKKCGYEHIGNHIF